MTSGARNFLGKEMEHMEDQNSDFKKLRIIGSEEWCVFEELEIPAIKARVDSGQKPPPFRQII